MKLHVLKIKKEYLYLVSCGLKKAELRRDDRDYNVNDIIHFVDENGKDYPTFEDNLFIITHVFSHGIEYGLLNGYVMLSIKKLS